MFHNIFEKKERKKGKVRSKIIIDFREKNSLVPSEIMRLNLDIEFKRLEIGDYLVNNTIIERKTINDLKSSIINKRIFTQLKNIKQYELYVLVLEGDSKDLFNNQTMNNNSIRGFLLSTQLNHKIPIIFTKDERETALYIELISRKKEKFNQSINPKKILKTIEEQKQFILESFPGIGPKTATKLIDKFGSLNDIFNAKESKLEEIIGEKVKSFYKLVHY